MQILATSAYVLGCVLLALGAVACASPEQVAATDDLITTINEANADGHLTLDEKALIDEKARAITDAPGIDWGTVGATLGATAIGAFPALRLLLPLIPNRIILGNEADPEVARAAGLTVAK
jgi:hypothetical protein